MIQNACLACATTMNVLHHASSHNLMGFINQIASVHPIVNAHQAIANQVITHANHHALRQIHLGLIIILVIVNRTLNVTQAIVNSLAALANRRASLPTRLDITTQMVASALLLMNVNHIIV